MEVIKYKEIEFSLRNNINELTVEEFGKIVNILNLFNINKEKDNESFYDKWIKIFELLNMPQEIINNMDVDSFFEIINSFDFNFEGEVLSEIELNGIKWYTNDGDKFTLKIKKLKEIASIYEKLSDDDLCFVYIIARLYTNDSDISNEDKIEYFKNLNATIIIPILEYINKNLTKYLEIKNG